MNTREGGLTGESLDCLLRSLDGDRDAAGEKYVVLRRKLVRFFEWRGAASPDECADRTLNVAARRIAGGEHVRNVSSYCVGIARLVLLESLRNTEREQSAIEGLGVSADAPAQEGDALREAFERCLEALPATSRDLILTYYSSEGRSSAETRKRLAARLAVPVNAVRLRAFRVRAQLESAVRAALESDDSRKK